MAKGTILRGLIAFAAIVTLLGCSTPSDQAFFDSATGKHMAGWLPAQHAVFASGGTTTLGNAIPSTGACVECHGADLAGGISRISCTSCHLGGPTSIHPADWMPIVLAHGPSVSSGTTTTAQCANQYCHGPALAGVSGSGPACTDCHSWPFDPLSVHCGSCHGIPPAGTRYPNMAGRHAVHTEWTGTALAGCSVCHNGSDGASGTVRHFDSAVEVAFNAAYNAKAGGTATYNAVNRTCSAVSCHGGQTTPNWMTGSINVNTQCGACHQAGTAQYNSYNSGAHSLHLVGEIGAVCTDCHDTTKLAFVHFTNLSSPTPTQAYLTMQNFLSYTGTGGGSFGTCTMTCHGETHNNRPW